MENTKSPIQQFIEERQIVLIWGLAFILLFVLIIVSLLVSPKPTENPNAIKVPININEDDPSQNPSIKTDTSIFSTSTNPQKAELVKVAPIEIMTKIDLFIADNDLKVTDKKCVTNYCYWRGDGFDIDWIQLAGRISLSFEKPILAKNLAFGNTSIASLTVSFNNFVKRYLDEKFQYSNFTLEPFEADFAILANRTINNSKIFGMMGDDRTEKLVFTGEGKLVYASFFVIDYVSSVGEYDLISGAEIVGRISSANYPKVVYPYSIKEAVNPDTSKLVANYSDKDDLYPTPYLLGCNASSAEYAYYLSDQDSEKAYPVYRIVCSGVTQFDSRYLDVTNIIFANAIDPSFVDFTIGK